MTRRVGRKDDAGKPRWHLIPWEVMDRLMEVIEFGANKYAPDNWRKVPNPRERYWNAAFRHLISWRKGEILDKESGLPHLAHAVCDVLFLLAFEKKNH